MWYNLYIKIYHCIIIYQKPYDKSIDSLDNITIKMHRKILFL